MANVFSGAELSADDPSHCLLEPLTSHCWNFYHRRISQVEPMEPADFLDSFRCRLNYTRQCRFSHPKNSFYLLIPFKWYLDVMVHHGEHVETMSKLLAESRLIIALRQYEKWVKENHDWSSVSAQRDAVRRAAFRMKRRRLKMSQENSRADKDE